MPFIYKTEGVCPTYITVTLDNDVIEDVQFDGGCDGNLKAIRILVRGMTVQKVQEYFSDIVCEDKKTSCSAQLAKAVLKAYESNAISEMSK
jgi:uncharacterized protein (TIGR03905 family)